MIVYLHRFGLKGRVDVSVRIKVVDPLSGHAGATPPHCMLPITPGAEERRGGGDVRRPSRAEDGKDVSGSGQYRAPCPGRTLLSHDE